MVIFSGTTHFISKYFFGFRGSNFKMDTNPKILHCPNPRTCAGTSCSLHGSLGQNLLAQAYQKPTSRDWSLFTGTTVLEKNLTRFKFFF